MWIRFMDMHSGGGQKLEWPVIFLEADGVRAACELFEKLFGLDPQNVTCDCCGSDYSVDETETLEESSAYDRGIGRFGRNPIIDFADFERQHEVWDMSRRVKAKIVPPPVVCGTT